MPAMSFSSFVDYLRLEKKYSPHTVDAYINDLKGFESFLAAAYDECSPESVSYGIIRNWIIHLVDSGISNRTVNRQVSTLKTYYKFLLKTGTIESNPLSLHKALKTPKKIQVPFSQVEIEEVLEVMEAGKGFENVRDRLMVELFYSTGIRRAELINIRLNDISFPRKTLKILGKRNKERIIPVLPRVFKILEEYMPLRDALPRMVDGDFLFVTAKGVKVYENLVYRTINSYFGQVSAKAKKSPHILRHTFATHLLNEGADISSVKELLGHSSLASTQVYTGNSIEKLKEAYGKAHPRT